MIPLDLTYLTFQEQLEHLQAHPILFQEMVLRPVFIRLRVTMAIPQTHVIMYRAYKVQQVLFLPQEQHLLGIMLNWR